MKAKFVKDLDGFSGKAKLYELEPALEGNKHVVVSAANAMFTGPETYIFGSDDKGEIANWGELDGSYRGGLDHARALQGAGYAVTNK